METAISDDEGKAKIQCPNCRWLNSVGARYCNGCGARLPRICPSCDSANEPESRYCSDCGASLGEHSSAVSEPPLRQKPLEKAPTRIDQAPLSSKEGEPPDILRVPPSAKIIITEADLVPSQETRRIKAEIERPGVLRITEQDIRRREVEAPILLTAVMGALAVLAVVFAGGLLFWHMDPFHWRGIPSRLLVTGRVSASSGGDVRSNEGAAIVIPPNALSRDAWISISVGSRDQFPVSPQDAIQVSLPYQLGLDEEAIWAPIRIVLPYEQDAIPEGANEAGLYAAYFDGQQWIAQEGEIDADADLVYVVTTHTSWWEVLLDWGNKRPSIEAHADPPLYTGLLLDGNDLDKDLVIRATVNDPDGLEDIQRVEVSFRFWNLAKSAMIALSREALVQTRILIPLALSVPDGPGYTTAFEPMRRVDGRAGEYEYVLPVTSLSGADLAILLTKIEADVRVTDSANHSVEERIVIPIWRLDRPRVRLLDPSPGSVQPPTPTFRWEVSITEGGHAFDVSELLISRSEDLFSIFPWNNRYFALGWDWSQYKVPDDKSLSSGSWYWALKLVARGSSGEGAEMLVGPVPFAVGNRPPSVSLDQPADGASVSEDFHLEWTSHDPEGDHTNHVLYLDDDPDPWTEPLHRKEVGSNHLIYIQDQLGIRLRSGTYYWGIEAYNMDSQKHSEIAGTRIRSEIWSFTVRMEEPTPAVPTPTRTPIPPTSTPIPPSPTPRQTHTPTPRPPTPTPRPTHTPTPRPPSGPQLQLVPSQGPREARILVKASGVPPGCARIIQWSCYSMLHYFDLWEVHVPSSGYFEVEVQLSKDHPECSYTKLELDNCVDWWNAQGGRVVYAKATYEYR